MVKYISTSSKNEIFESVQTYNQVLLLKTWIKIFKNKKMLLEQNFVAINTLVTKHKWMSWINIY